MKKIVVTFMITFLTFLFTVPAMALPLDPAFIDGPQDRLFLTGDNWHELGNAFPSDELIVSNSAITGETACRDPNSRPDDPSLLNYRIAIENRTNIHWHDLHYVADLGATTITNYDGHIANASLQDWSLAFRIDNLGVNTPLLYESMTPDLIFEPGENWQFIIQDYINIHGVAFHMFGSPGIVSLSLGVTALDFSSGGSIIAKPVPLPGAILLLGPALLCSAYWL